MTRLSRNCSLAALTALAAPLVAAQSPSPAASPPVEVTAPRLRDDVTALCPAIHEQLPDALVGAFRDSAARGSVDVMVTVQGDGIGRVHTFDGPTALQRAVRRAVRLNVDCRTTEPAAQHVHFRVVFADAAPARAAAGAGPAVIVAARR